MVLRDFLLPFSVWWDLDNVLPLYPVWVHLCALPFWCLISDPSSLSSLKMQLLLSVPCLLADSTPLPFLEQHGPYQNYSMFIIPYVSLLFSNSCVCACLVCMCVNMNRCACVWTCTYTCGVYVCEHVCVCRCTCMCVHVHVEVRCWCQMSSLINIHLYIKTSSFTWTKNSPIQPV